MKNLKCILSTCLLLFLAFNGKAMTHTAPPDSTTNLVDKSAALLIIEEGKKMFFEGKVRDALILFRQSAVKDPNSWRPPYWISMCHYRLDNYGFALKYAKQAVDLDSEIDKDIFELLGKSYHRIGELDSAIMYYTIALNKLNKNQIKDLKINERIEECNFAKAQLAVTPFAVKEKIGGEVNSGYNDYAPIIANNGKILYFTSRRNNTTGGGMNPEEDQYFEDIYKAQWNEESKSWDSVSNELDRLNATGFEAFSHVSKDGLTAYMTINNEAVDEVISTQSSDIFEVQFTTKGKWGSPKKINNKSINTSFFDAGATVTADGNTMYFVSNRNAEKKLTDIYVVQKVGKKWGEAVPVSDSINTAGNEATPFISADGRYLFFSSDTHPGMGGYDIFVSENLGNTWSKPVNLGAAINTVNNDTHFQYYPELKLAVFAGFMLQGQKASLDIFQLDMTNFAIKK